MSRTDPDRPNHSVLLVMEDRLLAEDLGESLGKVGYGVIFSSASAASGPGFSAAIDIIVIDTDMAGVEHAEAVDIGGQMGRRLGRPVVYLVDDADQASHIDKQADGSHFVVWPFPPGALQDTLQRALLAAGQSLPS